MQAERRGAHDSVIWTLAWHPAGHLLATGSGDTCTKFWGRARPGDPWRDREQREQEENAATEGVELWHGNKWGCKGGGGGGNEGAEQGGAIWLRVWQLDRRS